LLLQLVDIPTMQSLSLPGDEQPMLAVARALPAKPKLIPRDQPLERRAPLIRTGIAGRLRAHLWRVGHRAPG
jgi:ABC-type branched-subunit amino acid transport system ATPase component